LNRPARPTAQEPLLHLCAAGAALPAAVTAAVEVTAELATEFVTSKPQLPPATPAPALAPLLHQPLHQPLARTLQQNVIPRLAQAHRSATAVEAALAKPTAHEVEVFAARIIDGSEAGILSMLERLRRRGATPEMIYLDLLAPVARYLGKLWEDDRCDFGTVTAGSARLQRLMRELSPSFGAFAPLPAHARSILLAQAPDEQHNLGLSMVAEFFRRAGWLVVGGVGPYGGDPATRAHAEWFDVVGLSLGSESRLPWLREKIAAVRLASRNAAVVVMVGGPLFNANPQWVDHVGADAWAQDAREAPGLAAQHVNLLAERA
jgi:MerR family transcriptional regulator, light-induced transcriptional regulator